jgi:hypothetical protein
MGYLMNDNRNSGGELFECDTVSCKHCRAVLKVLRRQKEGYWCPKCHGPVCEVCAATKMCAPFLANLEKKMNYHEKIKGQEFFRRLKVNG